MEVVNKDLEEVQQKQEENFHLLAESGLAKSPEKGSPEKQADESVTAVQQSQRQQEEIGGGGGDKQEDEVKRG